MEVYVWTGFSIAFRFKHFVVMAENTEAARKAVLSYMEKIFGDKKLAMDNYKSFHIENIADVYGLDEVIILSAAGSESDD